MTKTLTEQWREGTLPEGYYYIDYDTQQRIFEIEDGCATYQGLPAETYFLNDVCLIKVLAPVPSYEEYNELLRHSELSRNLVYEVLVNQKEYNELLDKAKEYKRLQERLAIATKALKEYADSSNWYETDDFGISAVDQFACDDYGYNIAQQALKEMEGVK